MEVLWFGYMEEVVCNEDDLVLNPLFIFEPMARLEGMFGSTGNGMCKSILNMSKALNLSDG